MQLIKFRNYKSILIFVSFLWVSLQFSNASTIKSLYKNHHEIKLSNIIGYSSTFLINDYVRGDYPLHPVSWIDEVGAVSEGSKLTKTSAANSWNSGAVSRHHIVSGDDGKVVMTIEKLAYRIFLGLSVEDVDAGYEGIDYGYLLNQSNCYVYERGLEQSYLGIIAVGDELEIERVEGVIYYVINGEVRYVSSELSGEELMVDASIMGFGHYIDNVQLSRQLSKHYYSIFSGNWSDPTIWSNTINGSPINEVPSSADSVHILGHNIVIQENASCSFLRISNEFESSSVGIVDGQLQVFGEIRIENEPGSNKTARFYVEQPGSVVVLEEE